MKQLRHINLKLPIFSWLFFLFLSSGISYYHNNLQFGKPVLVERVDLLISNSGKKKRIAEFLTWYGKRNFFQDRNFQLLRINILSGKLDNHVHIILNKQFYLFKLVLQNIILHFRSRNLALNSSDDFPDFIS